MSKGIPANPALKAEIINKVRNEGMRVTDVATQYEVSSKSIYTWLREGVVDGNRNLILELNRLRKENEQLYRLLGRATAEMQKSKN
jgi:transposase-like protein